jgi:hypothetical protein
MQNTGLILLFCAVFALIAGWSLLRAWSTGRISSRGWTFQKDDNPFGFWFVAIIDLGILAGSLWFALHALGLVGDLPSSITIQLPSW